MLWSTEPIPDDISLNSLRAQIASNIRKSSLKPPGTIYKLGEIEFSGRSQTAKFAIISSETKETALRYLFSTKWNLKPPTMLISVFGTDFEMAQKLKKIFKRGLWKAADNAGCWIITDGLSRGITRLTGEAIRDYTDAYGGRRMSGFGICRKSCIAHYESIENAPYSGHKPVLYKSIESVSLSAKGKHILDPNFSYILIIDDTALDSSGNNLGTSSLNTRVVIEKVMTLWPAATGEVGVDNKEDGDMYHWQHKASADTEVKKNRAEPWIEKGNNNKQFNSKESGDSVEFNKTKSGSKHSTGTGYRVPICGLMIGGDFTTLIEVAESVNFNKCPLVIVKGTGGTADLLASIMVAMEELQEQQNAAAATNNVAVPPGASNGTIKNSTINEDNDAILEADERMRILLNEYISNKAENVTEKCIEIYMEKIKIILITHLSLVSVFDIAEDWDLDGYMISSFLSSANPAPKTDLNLEQLDITLRLNRADIARTKIFLEGKRWEKDSLNSYMYRALMTDKHEFVRLFIDQGFSLDEFMTVHVLERLYMDQLSKLNSKMALFRQLWAPSRNHKVTLRDVGKMIKLLLGEFYQPLYLSKSFHSRLVNSKKEDKKSETVDAIIKMSNVVTTPGVIFAGKAPKDSSTLSSPKKMNTEEEIPNGVNPPDYSNRRKSSLDFILNFRLRQSLSRINKGAQDNDDYWNIEEDGNLKRRVKLERPARELMIWSLLVGKLNMTELFWTLEKEPVAAALFTSMLLNSLAHRTDDFTDKEDYHEEARHFESLAEGVLNECYREDERRAQLLINRELDFYGHTSVIRLAAQGKCIKFMAHPCCQDFLTNTWMGRLANKNSSRTIAAALFLGISIPFLIPKILYYKYQDKENNLLEEAELSSPVRHNTLIGAGQGSQINRKDSYKGSCDVESNSDQRTTELKDTIRMTIDFYMAPVIRFAYNMIFYAGFLSLYSYIMLENFNVRFKPHDYFLIFWIVTLFIEEVKQIIKEGTFKTYISDGWNKLDCFAISLFLIGFILRLIVLYRLGGEGHVTAEMDQFFMMTDDVFVTARIFYSFSLFVFYVRLMYIFSFHIALGPKLVMIGKMVYNDLIPFMIILGVILMGYAIASHGISYPNGFYAVHSKQDLKVGDKSLEQKTDMAQNFITIYYQMYGDFGLDKLRGNTDYCTKENKCPHWTGQVLVPIMMGMFVLMTNILLFNLLIAMFSRTYEEIESSSTYYWNFQRYEMIAEYIDRSPLAPPFIIIWYCYGIFMWIRRKTFIASNKIYENPEDPFCKDYNEENPVKNRELIKWEHMKATDYMRNVSEPVGASGFVPRQRATGANRNVIMLNRARPATLAAGAVGASADGGPSAGAMGGSGGSRSHSLALQNSIGSASVGNGSLLEFQLERIGKEITNQTVSQLHNVIMQNQFAEMQKVYGRLDQLEETLKRIFEQQQQQQQQQKQQQKQQQQQLQQPQQQQQLPSMEFVENMLKQIDRKVSEKVELLTVQQSQSSKPRKVDAYSQITIDQKDAKILVTPRRREKSTNTLPIASVSTATSTPSVSKVNVAIQSANQSLANIDSTTTPSVDQQFLSRDNSDAATTGGDGSASEEYFTAYRAKMLDIEDASVLSRMMQIEPRRPQAGVPNPNEPDPDCDPRQLPDRSLLSSSYRIRGYFIQREVMDHRLWRICPVNFEIYPGVRANVPSNLRQWTIPYNTYAPFQISDEHLVYPNIESYDPLEISLNIVFNSYDRTYRIWRISIGDRYLIDKDTNLPLNPRGRTGLSGRGFLPRWGPNLATFILLTRRAPSNNHASSSKSEKGRRVLEFGAIKSGETLFIPFYFTDHLETCFLEDCVVNIVLALLYRRVRHFNSEEETNRLINPVLCASISVISEAYINDTLNADNAWIEGILVNFHESEDSPFEDKLLEAMVEDSSKEGFRWAKIARSSQIRQSHKTLLKKLAYSRQAIF